MSQEFTYTNLDHKQRKVIPLEGHKYGRLLVLNRVGSLNGRSTWNCHCDCGNLIGPVTSNALRSGNVRSCGCLLGDLTRGRVVKPRLTDQEYLENTLFNWVKYAAKRCGREFNLTHKQVLILSSSSCVYCDKKPSRAVIRGERTLLLRNGIDRIDNKKGYTTENSQPCCTECNWMKGKLGHEEFLAWIKNCYLHSVVKATWS